MKDSKHTKASEQMNVKEAIQLADENEGAMDYALIRRGSVCEYGIVGDEDCQNPPLSFEDQEAIFLARFPFGVEYSPSMVPFFDMCAEHAVKFVVELAEAEIASAMKRSKLREPADDMSIFDNEL